MGRDLDLNAKGISFRTPQNSNGFDEISFIDGKGGRGVTMLHRNRCKYLLGVGGPLKKLQASQLHGFEQFSLECKGCIYISGTGKEIVN
jgi:hypothetical protein